MKWLNHIRKPEQKIPISKAFLYTALLFCLGLIIGAIAKLFDIYTTNLGLVAAIVLFDKLRISDILFTLLMGFILFKK